MIKFPDIEIKNCTQNMETIKNKLIFLRGCLKIQIIYTIG